MEGALDTVSENAASFGVDFAPALAQRRDRAKLAREAGMAHMAPGGGIELEPPKQMQAESSLRSSKTPVWFSWDKVSHSNLGNGFD